MSWKIEDENLISYKINDLYTLYIYKYDDGIKFKVVENNENNKKEVILFSKKFDNAFLGILKK